MHLDKLVYLYLYNFYRAEHMFLRSSYSNSTFSSNVRFVFRSNNWLPTTFNSTQTCSTIQSHEPVASEITEVINDSSAIHKHQKKDLDSTMGVRSVCLC